MEKSLVDRKPYEFLDHPSDLKMRSFGPTLEAVFIHAATAMMEVLYGNFKITHESQVIQEEITVTAKDLESLLVEWLSELLYLSDTYHRVYCSFNVHQLTTHQINATVKSTPAEAIHDIKAVTFSELSIIKIDDGWQATIVCDL